jgi:uncharacterized membrane protein YeaQ/YmgE (transglycosylase-associated protein family)
MDFVVYLLILAVWGLFVGAFARLALPGKDPMSIWQTMAVGLAGTLVAGVVMWLITERPAPGFFVSLVFSVLIVYLIRRSRGGGLTSPGLGGRGRHRQ